MQMISKKRMFMLFSGLLLLAASCAAQSFTFSPIDVPCSGCPDGIARATIAQGINAAGNIVGIYYDAVNALHGFLLRRGEFTSIDFPGAVTTSALGIGPSGDIVGSYTAPLSSATADSPAYCPASGSPACTKGFLYRRGKFSTLLSPGHPGAIAQRITPNGDIYGCLHDLDLGNSMFGTTWTRFGEISLAADGGELADPSQSVSPSMNNGATPDGRIVVGLWNDSTGHRHGFVVQNGIFQSYDVPGSILTAIWDINPGQEFVGTYVDNTGHRHGFLQFPDGAPRVTIDYPGADHTLPYGVNEGGLIVGYYVISGKTHGFVAVPPKSD